MNLETKDSEYLIKIKRAISKEYESNLKDKFIVNDYCKGLRFALVEIDKILLSGKGIVE